MWRLTFVSGVPVAIDGTAYSPATLLETLNHLAGENGVGRVDMVENRFVGMKSRGVYETRGGLCCTLRIGLWNPSPWTAR
jgi:argininosuccinate synthase